MRGQSCGLPRRRLWILLSGPAISPPPKNVARGPVSGRRFAARMCALTLAFGTATPPSRVTAVDREHRSPPDI
jgi:hypothetical protein